MHTSDSMSNCAPTPQKLLLLKSNNTEINYWNRHISPKLMRYLENFLCEFINLQINFGLFDQFVETVVS